MPRLSREAAKKRATAAAATLQKAQTTKLRNGRRQQLPSLSTTGDDNGDDQEQQQQQSVSSEEIGGNADEVAAAASPATNSSAPATSTSTIINCNSSASSGGNINSKKISGAGTVATTADQPEVEVEVDETGSNNNNNNANVNSSSSLNNNSELDNGNETGTTRRTRASNKRANPALPLTINRRGSRSNVKTNSGNANSNASASANVKGSTGRRRRGSQAAVAAPSGSPDPQGDSPKVDDEEEAAQDASNNEESGEEPVSIVVLNTTVNNAEEEEGKGEEGGSVVSPVGGGGSVSSSERSPSESEECQSFFVIVNSDGSLQLDQQSEAQTELGKGQERFTVVLPKSKVKSTSNPLPGAVVVNPQRSRKSKPEGVTYGGDCDVGFLAEANTNAKSEDTFNDIHVEESSVLNSEAAAKDPAMSVGINPAPAMLPTAAPIDIDEFTKQLDPQSLATLENLIQSHAAEELVENLSLENSIAGDLTGERDKWKEKEGLGGASIMDTSDVTPRDDSTTPTSGKRGKQAQSKARNSSSIRVSEGDSGNVRRSQRQQDRIERQEAERILAENQQMLQREKEMMKEGPLKITPMQGGATPVSEVSKGIPVSSSSPGDSCDSAKSDRRLNPKRARKLPAHLADPNYISLDDEGKSGPKETPDKSTATDTNQSRRSSTHSKAPTDEEVEPALEIDENPEEDENYAEDDPNRLWCICRKPHNNRFMICCDKCEEWFHGKCVNITKQQGKRLELLNTPWICPPCKKKNLEKEKQKKEELRLARKQSVSAKRAGDVDDKNKRLSKAAAAQQAEAAAAAIASKSAVAPEKIAQTKRSGPRKSESMFGDTEEKGCVSCKKPARKDSIFCSDACVQKHAADSIEKSKAVTSPTQVPAASSPTSSKLKRSTSKSEVQNADPFLAFHVISSGTPKSTEVVPPKPKEVTASQLVKSQKETPPVPSSPKTQSPQSQGQESQATSRPGASVGGSSPAISKKSSIESDKDKDKNKGRSRNISQSESKSKASKKQEKETSKNKERSERGEKEYENSEKLHRENMRKGLRELLKQRMKEMSEEEQRKVNSGSYTPEVLAEKIEEELCRVYGGAHQQKCKSKYRSIYFNLKDSKNSMYKELLNGNVKPRELVKMEPHEMASAELAEWRKKEAQKELEAIKKAELDKIAENKKLQLIEKGIENALEVAEEFRPHDICDIIDQPVTKDKDHSKEKEKSKSAGRHSSSLDRKASTRSEKEKDSKDKTKERRHSERHKSSSRDKDRESSRRSHHSSRRSSSHRSHKDKDGKVKHLSKDKNKEKDAKRSRDRKVSDSETKSESPTSEEPTTSTSFDDNESSKGAVEGEVSTSSEIQKPLTPTFDSPLLPSSTPENEVSEKKVEPLISERDSLETRQSIDSEQEMPSSTIKTPEFTDEGTVPKKESDTKPMFETRVVMPELGGFNASAHAVSHFNVDGVYFPESPVPIVGRISPDTVWDYLDKMKKTKEVIVFRLSPSTPDDSEGYMEFFSYFSSRTRLGVMGGISPPLKDVYLIPLDKHSPINRSLLPFRGPGLPKERTHCLLCVVTRNIRDPTAGLKRKSSMGDGTPVRKKSKATPSTEKLKGNPESSADSVFPTPVPVKDDDDAPYTPWEEEEEVKCEPETVPNLENPPAPLSLEMQKELQAIEERILREKQDIEKITGALAGRTTIGGIPGLDGEFPENEEGTSKEVSKSQPSDSDIKQTLSVAPTIPKDINTESIPVEDPRLKSSRNVSKLSATSTSPASVTVPTTNESTVGAHDVDLRVLFPQTRQEPTIKEPTPVISLSDDSSSNSKDTIESQTSATIPVTGDPEEAYSPSAIQFSDEDSAISAEQKSNSESNVLSKDESHSLELIQEKEIKVGFNEEPNPPGVENFECEKFAPTTPVKSDQDITIKLSNISPQAKGLLPSSLPQPEIDLEDNFQPMIPPASKSLTTSAEPVFENTVVSKPKPSTGLIASKMKININLTTKQLPLAELESDKVEVPVNSGSSSGIANTANTLAGIVDTKTLPPINIHEPPPTLKPPSLPDISHPPPPISMYPPTTVPSSVVINLNVPPPPIIPSMIPKPPMIMPPQMMGPTPSPGASGMIPHPPFRATMTTPLTPFPPGTLSALPTEEENRTTAVLDEGRVERNPFDRDRDERFERSRDGRHARDNRGNRDRDYGRVVRDRMGHNRRQYHRGPPERIRRRRTRSRSKSRSRSRSPRDRSRSRERRHRKRGSKSRSKSPLSRRWEARNRSRSPGRKARNRSRSKSYSPSRKSRRSASPRRIRRNRSNSKSQSPPPSARKRRISNRSDDKSPADKNSSGDDWECDNTKTKSVSDCSANN